ncbi:phage tail length tape measure family protein [Roseateles sp. BYS96W]|uniref:Phage tail length tape measure family protein n=1 Tax=Pelomonas nitida TaxID=3299027 RepID=A0ABW7G7D5_9BURK
MTENAREVELRATMDASGVRAGVEQAKTAIVDLGKTAEREGAKAGDNLGKTGDGAEKAAAKVAAAQSKMQAAIERSTAALQAGERGTSAYFEALSKQRGLSVDALKPYLDDLRKAEVAQKAASSSLGGIGVSAAQTSAALRQLPAQFTDIVTSLQGGQAPLTVLLQQGGQIKDSFGGAGAAARALGGYVLGLVNPFTVAAAAAGLLGLAYIKGAEEAQAFQKTLILTGNVAGVTAQELSGISASIAGSGVTQGAAAEALNLLASSGKIGAESLGRFAAAAVQLQRVGGPAVEDTAKAFADLGKDPLKASIKLDESTNFLTASVYKQIKALEEQGRAAEAARVAQEAYASAIEDRFPRLEKNLGSLERLWLNIKDATSFATSAAKAIGRDDTIVSLEAKIAQAKRRRDVLSTGNAADQTRAVQLTEELRIMEQQLATLEAQESPAKARAATAAQEAKDKAALQEFDKQSLQYLSKSAQMERELTAARNQYQVLVERGLISVQQYRDVLDGIRDKARDKSADNAAQRALEQEAALLERLSGLSGTYQKDLRALKVLRDGTAAGEERYVDAVKELIAKQPFAVKLEKEQAEAAKQVADAMARGNDLYLKKIDAMDQSAEAVAKQVQKLRDEEEALGVSAALNVSLAQAVELVAIKRLDEQRARAVAANDQRTADALQREIDKRKELADVIGNKETRDAAKKSAEEATKEWTRASNEIERTLTDALMRGFESGKGFARNLWDAVVNLFKTQVIKANIQPYISQFAGGIGSMLGLTGTATAATGSGVLGGAGSIGSLGSLLGLSGLGSAFSGGAMLAINGGTGLALDGAGALLGSGAWGQGLAQGAGALAPWALGGAAGIFGGRAISGGYSAFGGSGNAAVNIGTALGTVFAGPIGSVIGGAIGGIVNRAFGMGAKQTGETGITGSVNASGFAGQAYANWTKKGGWFRSDKHGTDLSAISAEQDAVLDTGIKALYQVTSEYAKVLSLPVDTVNNYAADFKVAWGKTEDENKAAIQAAITNLGDDLAKQFTAQLTPFQKAGETLSTTLARLSTLQTFSNSINSLGGIFAKIAGSSVDARERMIELAGGMDALSQQALGFAQNYYNRDEIAGFKAKDIQAALSSAGITTDVNSREQFRALVESINPATETGAKQLAVLLQLQGSFATVADYLAETGQTLSGAAAQAPASDALSPLLASATQQVQLAQQGIDAQYQTRDATLQIVTAVQQLTSVLITGTSAVCTPSSSSRQPEVVLA